VNVETSNLVCMLIIAFPFYRRQTVSEKGVVMSRDPFYIFSFHIITLEWPKLQTSNFYAGGHVKC